MTQVPQELTLITNPCGCEVRYSAGPNGTEYRIAYCPMHGAAPTLLAACEAVLEELCHAYGWADERKIIREALAAAQIKETSTPCPSA